MTPILTLTLNPALDISTSVAEVVAGPKLRCAPPVVDPGGGGINVSRAIRILGGESLALVALGGATGQRLADCLRREGVGHSIVSAPGETRQSLAVTDRTSGQQFRFVLPGEQWARADMDRMLTRLREIASPGTIVVLSGSQPPGIPDDFATRVAQELPPDAQLVLDTSGAALASAVNSPVPGLAILRMDDAEAEGLAGRPLPRREDSAAFAQGLVAAGIARCVIIARGAEGSVLADAEGKLFAPAPAVQVVSAVGAGDTFVAALVLAAARGAGRAEMLAHAVAAAAAACMTPATDLCRAEDVARLMATVRPGALA
jgi:6-phosphofructokinase 2